MNIPVVDFGITKLGENDVTDGMLTDLSNELRVAFTEVGFVYLRNTGVTQEEVDAVMEISKKFFLLPEEVKIPLRRKTNTNNHGWVSCGTERLNPHQPGDLKEAFNTVSLDSNIVIRLPFFLHLISQLWPSEDELAGFREAMMSFFLRCKDLSLQVLRVMALSLGIDPDIFLSTHRFIGSDKNGTTLRTLYYPPVRTETVKEGQLRCGEHSDYGSITLVFQSSEGGLQVKTRSGGYINAPSIAGTVLVNIADLMQRWTADAFISVVHRVLLPPPGDPSTRQSLVFFVQPDDEAVIIASDGSGKYPPVKSLDYLLERFNDSYGKI